MGKCRFSFMGKLPLGKLSLRKCTFGKFPLGKLQIWEVATALEKCLWKVPNTTFFKGWVLWKVEKDAKGFQKYSF